MDFIREKAFFIIFIVVFSVFSIYNIKEAEAQPAVCCERTKSGESCVNTDINSCEDRKSVV